MEISVLKLFVDVVRQGSFAAVARDLNIDPSSVSRAIAGLEKELDLRLLQRTTRQLSLTEAGKTYFDRIEPLIEELQQASDLATDVVGQPKGQLRVTASVSFGLKCIVPLLPQFEQHYPELSVDLVLTDAVVDLLTDRIDIAIRLGLLQDSTLIAQQLMRTHYRVCASPDYLQRSPPIKTPQDIADHQCLRFPLAGFQTQWLFKDAQGTFTEVPVHGKLIISNGIALQHCAIASMGLALLPNWLIHEDLRSGKLVDVLPAYEVTGTDFSTAAWLVYPSRCYVPLKLRVFIEFLKQNVPPLVTA
ncbi:LysR family transcriptional regulator [Acaryochloris sp. IP29b_bin.137]|uniref:LysR family transcriptional regulator n=1 Tax=Acaryochloris sp. IP29b_bin.137 TaxID=2969217 RepID=UPI0026375CDE|nr:LysR family transcriptional regulator [Acaryochloris sp. IP29b_bin.137]